MFISIIVVKEYNLIQKFFKFRISRFLMDFDWRDLIIIPQGPSERVDKIRLETAWFNRSGNTKFIIAGADEDRLELIENFIYNFKKAHPERVKIIKNTKNYAEVFNKSLPYIKKVSNFGVSTNYMGGKRFDLYLESAIQERLIGFEKGLYCLKTKEWLLNPFERILEEVGYKKDKRFFRNQDFTIGLEEKSRKSVATIFGKGIRKVLGK